MRERERGKAAAGGSWILARVSLPPVLLPLAGVPVLCFFLLWRFRVPEMARELARNAQLRALAQALRLRGGKAASAGPSDVVDLTLLTTETVTDEHLDALVAAFLPPGGAAGGGAGSGRRSGGGSRAAGLLRRAQRRRTARVSASSAEASESFGPRDSAHTLPATGGIATPVKPAPPSAASGEAPAAAAAAQQPGGGDELSPREEKLERLLASARVQLTIGGSSVAWHGACSAAAAGAGFQLPCPLLIAPEHARTPPGGFYSSARPARAA